MSDEIQRLSAELAHDPASLVFVQLGEMLRQRGQLDTARKVTTRGLERHPHHADAHDLLARISVDAGELERAFDEWDTVLSLAGDHVGAHKGLGYVLFKQGKLPDAERHLAAAATHHPDDASIATALRVVRQMLGAPANATDEQMPPTVPAAEPGRPPESEPPSEPPSEPDLPATERHGTGDDARLLFVELLGDGAQTAILLDGDGLVTAGAYMTEDGQDVAQEIGAELSGVRDEAQRAIAHLDLGDWRSVTFETEVATVSMAPVSRDALLLLAAARSIPLGFVRRTLTRCTRHAATWLEEEA
ncbi:MAG TPA: tetratricopeptide repeat protein [Gemmatimonadaceae bacterium]|nr:tetratricopeptide repeat protein [Gemmatimonadaceae bacterium]